MTDLVESKTRLKKFLPLNSKVKNIKNKKRKINRNLQNLLETLALFDAGIQVIYDSQKSKKRAKQKIKEWVTQEDNYEIGTIFKRLNVNKFLNERIFKKKS